MRIKITKISIIMPVKNGKNYMQEAINAIKKQNVELELIVVNDGSTDETEQIAKENDCIVLNHEQSKGQVIGKNTGLKVENGDYIMFCDHDDILSDNAILTMLDEFNQDNDLKVVNAKIKDFISPDATNKEQQIKPEAYYGCLAGSILFKKEVFDVIGLFDENVQAGEIIALMSKLEENNLKIKKIDFISSNRRIHDTNYGKTAKKAEFKDYAALLRAKLRR